MALLGHNLGRREVLPEHVDLDGPLLAVGTDNRPRRVEVLADRAPPPPTPREGELLGVERRIGRQDLQPADRRSQPPPEERDVADLAVLRRALLAPEAHDDLRNVGAEIAEVEVEHLPLPQPRPDRELHHHPVALRDRLAPQQPILLLQGQVGPRLVGPPVALDPDAHARVLPDEPVRIDRGLHARAEQRQRPLHGPRRDPGALPLAHVRGPDPLLLRALHPLADVEPRDRRDRSVDELRGLDVRTPAVPLVLHRLHVPRPLALRHPLRPESAQRDPSDRRRGAFGELH